MNRRNILVILTLSLSLVPAVIYSPAISSEVNLNVDLQGHRGSGGLEPENTWPAVRTAMLEGMTTIEIDLHYTRDKKFVLHHDYRLSPKQCVTLSGRRVPRVRVSEMNSDWLSNIHCAKDVDNKKQEESTLITLEHLFRLVTDYEIKYPLLKKSGFSLELKLDLADTKKKNEIARALVKVLEKSKMLKRVMITSFHFDVFHELKKSNPDIGTQVNLRKQRHFKTLKLIKKIRDLNLSTGFAVVDGVSLHQKNATKDVINYCHNSQLKVYVYTVNNTYKMQHYLNLGVDGIVTDYPNRLRHVFLNWYSMAVAKELFMATQG